MALRNILKDEDPVLRKKSREVTTFDEKLWILLDDMHETMIHANGVGLAAPQVGILRRAVIIEIQPGEKIELINPVITSMKGKQCEQEGCLSVPGVNGYVKRPAVVKVTAKNRYGKDIKIEGKELLARAICHEIDHLNGVLFTDKIVEMAEDEN